jgi:hypothetical protein
MSTNSNKTKSNDTTAETTGIVCDGIVIGLGGIGSDHPGRSKISIHGRIVHFDPDEFQFEKDLDIDSQSNGHGRRARRIGRDWIPGAAEGPWCLFFQRLVRRLSVGPWIQNDPGARKSKDWLLH